MTLFVPASDISRALTKRILQLVKELLSNGRQANGEWRVGSVYGEPGSSLAVQLVGHVPRDVAKRRAWRQTANRWWFELGTRFPANVCAGCERPVSISDGIALPHDQRVHDADCMIRFGRRWISEASVALTAMGIPASDGIMPEDAPYATCWPSKHFSFAAPAGTALANADARAALDRRFR